VCVCVCVLVGDKGITSHEPQTIPHKHCLSQWEVYIICQFLSHEGASLRHEKREPFSGQLGGWCIGNDYLGKLLFHEIITEQSPIYTTQHRIIDE
jgi:hypothetical protein